MDTTAPDTTGSALSEGKKGNGALNKATSGAHATVDKVAAAADRALQQAKPALERVTQAAHGTIDRAVGIAAPTAAWLNEKGSRLKTTQQQVYDDTCSYVAAHPLKAIAISLLAGYLLGKIVR